MFSFFSPSPLYPKLNALPYSELQTSIIELWILKNSQATIAFIKHHDTLKKLKEFDALFLATLDVLNLHAGDFSLRNPSHKTWEIFDKNFLALMTKLGEKIIEDGGIHHRSDLLAQLSAQIKRFSSGRLLIEKKTIQSISSIALDWLFPFIEAVYREGRLPAPTSFASVEQLEQEQAQRYSFYPSSPTFPAAHPLMPRLQEDLNLGEEALPVFQSNGRYQPKTRLRHIAGPTLMPRQYASQSVQALGELETGYASDAMADHPLIRSQAFNEPRAPLPQPQSWFDYLRCRAPRN